jgi:hypothetical protein
MLCMCIAENSIKAFEHFKEEHQDMHIEDIEFIEEFPEK